jgi:hypothetical protein
MNTKVLNDKKMETKEENPQTMKVSVTGLIQRFMMLVSIIICMLTFTACPVTHDPDDITKEVPVTGVTINPPASVDGLHAGGGTVTLTVAIEPADATDKTVNWSSNNTAIATVSNAGVVTGKGEGAVTITATTKSGNKTADFPLTVKPDPSKAPTELKSPIRENTTLKDLGMDIDYVFKGGWLNVENNATLTIEAGVCIQFTGQNSGLNIANNSTIKASGTAAKRIRLIGPTTNNGSWRGVQINSITPNVLEYVDIAHAGSENRNESAALYLRYGKANINNCLIDASLSNGITLDYAPSEFLSFGNNVISNCGKAPVFTRFSVGSYYLRNMQNNNTFPGNKNEYIHITGTESATEGNWTIPHLNGYPWYFESGLAIGTNATEARDVTIEPGAVLLMASSALLNINNNSHLIAVGTSQKRITIKGFADQVGFWTGIHVESRTPGTKLEYCDVINGGRTRGSFPGGAIAFGQTNGKVYFEIYNSTISKSLTHGLTMGFSANKPNPNWDTSCYLKHANVTLSNIEGNVFYIFFPTQSGHNALPTMSGTDWWKNKVIENCVDVPVTKDIYLP